MLKTIIVLPDGTELNSGVGTVNAIQSVTITECVNSGTELTLGSVCTNMVEAKIISPEGGLSVAAGDEIAVYQEEDNGIRHKLGLFTTEKPTRPSAHTMSITAYDRVSWLDRDLSQWLAGLIEWPYPLFDLAKLVCEACGLELANTEIPNGSYLVQPFSASGITGRQLMQWIGEIAGRFCRATSDGSVEFAWYTPATLRIGTTSIPAAQITCDNGDISIQDNLGTVSDDGNGNVTLESEYIQVTDDGQGNVTLTVKEGLAQQYYFQNGLSFEDYSVSLIEKVQLRQNEDDVGTVYPDVTGAVNTYIITGNYLLTASTAEDLKPVAQTLYEHLKNVSYTPCKVTIPANLYIRAGNTVQITDRNGKTITAYVMTRTQSGQKDTLSCTGSASRDSSTAVNNQSFQALKGKVLNLRAEVDGLKVENRDMEGKAASFALDLEGIKAEVSRQEDDSNAMKQQLTALEQTAQQVQIGVQSIQDNGVTKVKTQTGFVFDDEGLHISKTGSDLENSVTEKGVYVVRNKGASNEVTMLQADAHGVIATDVSVRNYLIVGNARFEEYTGGRTACFHYGG